MPAENRARDSEGRPTPRKVILLAAAFLAALAFVLVVRRPESQSRFLSYGEGGNLVFLDKDLPGPLRAAIRRDRVPRSDAFLAALGYRGGSVADRDLVVVAADGGYGALAADDPVVTRRLAGRASAELLLLARMSRDFFANEPVSRSNISADGRYVFLDAREPWEPSWIHALAHSLLVDSRGPGARARVEAGVDPGLFSPEAARGWEFLQESAALLAEGIFVLSGGDPGRLAEAAAGYGPSGAARFGPDGPVRAELALREALAVPPPRKDAAWYEACHGFGAWLLAEYGLDAVRGFLGRGLGGTWETLDDLVRPFGTDFPGLLHRWSGGKGLPPYRQDT